jgi:hypothetical protein
MGKQLFSSGPWVRYYNYRSHLSGRHRMDLHITFANGGITRAGIDEVGQFIIRGRYDHLN